MVIEIPILSNMHLFDRLTKLSLVASTCWLLSACSPLTLVNLSSPNWQQQRTLNIPFHTNSDALTLSVYRPKATDDSQVAPKPTIVFFYGGAWQSGSKEAYRFVASRLTKKGYVVVLPDYRLYPDVTFPAFVDDGAEALRWA